MNERLRLTSGMSPGDVDAIESVASFEELVGVEYAGLYSALCLITRDRGEAEDLAQEAFLRVWERWDRVRGMDHPTGYLYRTALNLYRKRLRRASVAVRRAVGRSGRRDELDDVETEDQVVRALGTLTPRQRASIVLVELLDYSSEDAAALMGIKAATVRVLASQARAALRRNAGETDE